MIFPGLGYIAGYTGDCSSCGYWGSWGGCTIHTTRPGGCDDYIARCNCAPIRGDYITAGKILQPSNRPTHCTSCGAPVDLTVDICPYCNVPYPAAQERRQRVEQLQRSSEALKAQAAQKEQNDILLRRLFALD